MATDREAFFQPLVRIATEPTTRTWWRYERQPEGSVN